LISFQPLLSTGIETVDGNHRELDIIMCANQLPRSNPIFDLMSYASGFETTFQFDFPIIRRSGVDLSTKFKRYPT